MTDHPTYDVATDHCERTTAARLRVGDYVSFDPKARKRTTLRRVTGVDIEPAPARFRSTYRYVITVDGNGPVTIGASTACWRQTGVVVGKTVAAIATTDARMGVTAREPPTIEHVELIVAAAEVAGLRAALTDAIARRNRILVADRAAGATVTALARIAGFASAGACQAAMSTVTD